MFYRCINCGNVMETVTFKRNMNTCTKCGYHGAFNYEERLDQIADKSTFIEWNSDFGFENPIDFPGYEEKYSMAAKSTNMKEAIITGECKICGICVAIGIMDNRFMMGSMGTVVGEKIARMFEAAEHKKLPVIIFSTSGGARMQEGIMSLLQMAKVSGAIAKFSQSGGVYISVLTNPTTGGVSASVSFLGDIILAEPKALIGFAGKRVIEQTIHENLPQGFQSAEYLLEHGFLDAIIDRKNMKIALFQLLKYHIVA